jgi:serine/threonine protein kinase
MEVLTPRPTIKVPPSPFPDIEGTQCNERVLWKTFFINDSHRVVLNEIIGMGCQGNVYTGISNLYGDVAVKEMNHIFFPDIHYKAEALGIGPAIYGVYYETNKTYIVMEKMVRTLTLKDMETYNQILCESLTVLIENGIFHNDLRDTNVMFDRYNKLRIIDYDSAVLAYECEDDILVPIVSFNEYEDLMKRNYYIFISERRYVLNYHFILQNRHHEASDKYSDMLYERCF